MKPSRGRPPIPCGSRPTAVTSSGFLFLLGSRFLFRLRRGFRAAASRFASLTGLTHIFDLLACYIPKLYQLVRCFDNTVC